MTRAQIIQMVEAGVLLAVKIDGICVFLEGRVQQTTSRLVIDNLKFGEDALIPKFKFLKALTQVKSRQT